MPRPLPVELRQRIIAARLEEHQEIEEVAIRFKVSTASVKRFARLQRETGGVAPKPASGGRTPTFTAQDQQTLLAITRQHADARVEDIARLWSESIHKPTSRSHTSHLLLRHDFTRKKKR